MIKELLSQVASKVHGLPIYSQVGAKKVKPITLPVVYCPNLRKGNSPGEAIATIMVTMKSPSLGQLYDEVESVISALSLPGKLTWRAASVATGTDGHYAEVIFEYTLVPSLPARLIPTAILESAEASYADP